MSWSPHEWFQCPSTMTQETLLSLCPAFCYVKRHKKIAIYEPGSGASPDTRSAGALSWTSHPPKLCETNFCCLNHPRYSIVIPPALKLRGSWMHCISQILQSSCRGHFHSIHSSARAMWTSAKVGAWSSDCGFQVITQCEPIPRIFLSSLFS